jgi:hypothetical protein
MPYHCLVRIPFRLPPAWGDQERWVKGDMVNAVAVHWIDLIRLGKDHQGKRQYQMETLPPELFRRIQAAVLHGLGLSSLTKHLPQHT